MAAATARSLADDVRRTLDAREPHVATRRRRRRARHRSAQCGNAPPRSGTGDEGNGVPTCPAAADELGAAAPATLAGIPEAAWASLDAVDLVAELQNPVPTLQDIPPFMRAAVRGALVRALCRLRSDYATTNAGDFSATSRAWKLFLLSPRMLLARPAHQGADGRAELLERAAAFDRGDWLQLLAAARASHRRDLGGAAVDAEALEESKRNRACAKVRMGELTRARQVLTEAELAPGDETTYRALTDPRRRPPEPRTAVPVATLQHTPAQPVRLTAKAVASALRDTRRGGAAGLSGMRAEHLKVLLQDLDAVDLLTEAATRLARAQIPTEVADGLARTRLTALRKPDGGVRGIATGDAFRRLVSRTLAKEWAATFDRATRPYQFALQARAGTDALATHVRAALALRPDAVLVSLDGRSAYDCMSRAAFLAKLHEVAPELLPFVRLFYGQPSTYSWWDDQGRCRAVKQGEGCEQGDPLAPALFALGQHDALHCAAASLHPDDSLVAFLDDLYITTTPSRARTSLDIATEAVASHCGIGSNLGKTRAIGARDGPPPPGMAELGDEVWRGDMRPDQRGVVVLGTPIGHRDFVQSWAARRLEDEERLLRQLPKLPDLQCSWLLLQMCASPRANHALRTVPPSEILAYARAHDQAMWRTLKQCLGGATEAEAPHAGSLATLPAHLGGLGLHSAERTSPAAYWAGLADALPVIDARLPSFAERYRVALEGGGDDIPNLRAAAECRELLQAEGWEACPSWRAILQGARPAPPEHAGPGDWPHGWQFYASRTRNQHFRDNVLLPAMLPSARALVRSQSGPHAGSWLTAIPAEPATTLAPQAMQLALRRRLRMPLPISHSRCGPTHGCGGHMDQFGDHALACPRTGLLARRAKTLELAWVRVAREAVGAEGQVVPQQWLVHTTAPGVRADDRRRLDVVIYGATANGTALCCDATLVSPLTRTGQPQPCTADVDGAALRTAERRKAATYPELQREGPQRLVVLGSEVGGRINGDAHCLLRDLVRVRACRAPPALRSAAASGWTRRWWSMLSVAVQQAVASTALGRPWPQPPHAPCATGPPLDRLLDLAEAEGPSRLPLRPPPQS